MPVWLCQKAFTQRATYATCNLLLSEKVFKMHSGIFRMPFEGIIDVGSSQDYVPETVDINIMGVEVSSAAEDLFLECIQGSYSSDTHTLVNIRYPAK